ncbi:MAG: hypothetical protein LBU87_01155 [Lactobacillales bacterium]|nr:hypothetical protein [Lactobacillales bacterium]
MIAHIANEASDRKKLYFSCIPENVYYKNFAEIYNALLDEQNGIDRLERFFPKNPKEMSDFMPILQDLKKEKGEEAIISLLNPFIHKLNTTQRLKIFEELSIPNILKVVVWSHESPQDKYSIILPMNIQELNKFQRIVDSKPTYEKDKQLLTNIITWAITDINIRKKENVESRKFMPKPTKQLRPTLNPAEILARAAIISK